MVTRRIFEVAVLDKLGIETSVGGVADVLEEDADKLVTDDFLLGGVDGEGGLDGLRQVFQVLRVVVHALVAQLPVAGTLLEVLADGGKLGGGEGEELAFTLLAVDGNGAFGGKTVGRSGGGSAWGGYVDGEMTEIVAGAYKARALLRLIEHLEALGYGTDNGLKALTGGYAGIVLRTPVHQVAAVGGSEEGRTVVDLKHQSPRAVGSTAERGVEHTFLYAPSAVVAGAETAEVLPFGGFLTL